MIFNQTDRLNTLEHRPQFTVLRSGTRVSHQKYHILHDFRNSIPLEENSSEHVKDLNGLKLLTNFDQRSFL